MRRWVNLVLVASAAVVAGAQWLLPGSMVGLLGGLLLLLVILAIFSQYSALHASRDAADAAHLRQLESERRYRALFDAGSDAVLVYALEEEGRPGRLVEVNEGGVPVSG